ncbi:MAG: CDP-glycerol glycerophosphotransferase family protein [Bacillota bacterium]|nr:CDP-glycerol glycerophosphotransferase family protein [Bacillota bacterium]
MVEEQRSKLAMQSLGTNLIRRGESLIAKGWCIYRFQDDSKKPIDPSQVKATLGRVQVPVSLKFSQTRIPLLKGLVLGKYEIEIPDEIIPSLDIQNRIDIWYEGSDSRIAYNIVDRHHGSWRVSKILKSGNMTCYLKQSARNSIYLTVREHQRYDEPREQRRIFAAWLFAKFWPKKDIIYLYEKECVRYEESASVLYERLIDQGYTNAYYVVNEGNPAIEDLPEKYKANLIYKDSFKHLLYFFKSKTFISSESMAHAMQLRAWNRRIVRKSESKDLKYVFLQHGVMYMVSLNAELRASFRQKDIELYRVVVSSELEASHFTDLGEFDRECLYVTGLATFDKSMRYDSADRIVIMPTWRRWESNQARDDFNNTKYFKMIERMVNAVPEELREKVVILPHPLMQKAMSESHSDLSRYLARDSHNDTLKQCDLLITDYSSISYDAYYRGSNVIFYWEEKDECMSKYGEGTKLMLNEDNAFGDVCYREDELTESIIKYYGKAQDPEYLRKYREIVTYHDGKNSERIIQLLKKDRVI